MTNLGVLDPGVATDCASTTRCVFGPAPLVTTRTAGHRMRLGITRHERDMIAYIRSLMPAAKEREMEIGAFAEAVRTYATLMGASATSWGRTTKHNTAVGGVTYSAHRFWMACDLVYDEPKPVEDRKAASLRLGLKLVVENDHDHLEPGDWIAG